jgi:Putative zinc-finger
MSRDKIMTTQSMNHQQAVETMAAERYLLREMTAEERRLFEEHYLECAECLEAVTFGTDFLEAGRDVAREQRHARATAAVPTWRERVLPVFAAWLRPAPAMAFALLLCLLGIGYQINTIRHQQQTIAALQDLRPEFRFVVRGEARSRSGDQSVITVRRNTQLSIRVEFTPGEEFIPYRADILAHDKAVKYSMPLSVRPTDDSVSFSIPAEALGPGTYALVIRRQSHNGSSKDLEKHFELHFTD